MTTKVLRTILIAGLAISALSIAACGKKNEAADATTAAEAPAAGATTTTEKKTEAPAGTH